LAPNNSGLTAKHKTRPADNPQMRAEPLKWKARFVPDIFADIREYRRHAKQCRELAANVDGFEKKHLEDIAEQWERRASEAEARLRDGPAPSAD